MSRPDKVFFPPVNWKVTKNYGVEQDVGPAVEHIYEVIMSLAVQTHGGFSRKRKKEMYSRLCSVIYTRAVLLHFGFSVIYGK